MKKLLLILSLALSALPSHAANPSLSGNNIFTGSNTFAGAFVAGNQTNALNIQSATLNVTGTISGNSFSGTGVGPTRFDMWDTDHSNFMSEQAASDIPASYTNVYPAAAATGLRYGANSLGIVTDSQIANGAANTVLVGGTTPAFGALPVMDGSPLTNLVLVLQTNAINTGILPCNKVTVTNLTGNITLGGFSGIDPNVWNTAILMATNSTGADKTVTLPPGIVGDDGQPQTSAIVTNQSSKVFTFRIMKNYTNMQVQAVGGGGGGVQNPMTATLNAAGFGFDNVGNINGNGYFRLGDSKNIFWNGNYVGGPFVTAHETSSSQATMDLTDGSANLAVRVGGTITATNGISSFANNQSSTSVSNVTVGASPYSWTNNLGCNIFAVIDGGTAYSAAWLDTTVQSSLGGGITLPLQPGEWLKITYTVAPGLYIKKW
jgi:hypothetical protein